MQNDQSGGVTRGAISPASHCTGVSVDLWPLGLYWEVEAWATRYLEAVFCAWGLRDGVKATLAVSGPGYEKPDTLPLPPGRFAHYVACPGLTSRRLPRLVLSIGFSTANGLSSFGATTLPVGGIFMSDHYENAFVTRGTALAYLTAEGVGLHAADVILVGLELPDGTFRRSDLRAAVWAWDILEPDVEGLAQLQSALGAAAQEECV